MAGNIGYAVLPVVPSTKDFQKKLNKSVLSAVNSSGKKASSALTKDFKSAFGEMEKASVKAQKAQEKSIKKVEKAEERLQKLRDRNADRQRITANKEKQLADTRVRLANQIAKQEQKVQKMRESGRSSLERIQQEESKLNKLRTEAPDKIIKKEIAIKKSRETGRDIAKKLSNAEKDLALAQKTSAEATKKASDLQAKLNGKEGQAAKRKDALRSSVQKVAIAYGHFERSVETAGKAIGSFSAKLGSGVLASVKRLGSAVSSTAKKIATSLGGAAVSQVQRFADSVKTGMTRATQAVAAAGTAIAGASIFKGFNRLSAIEESTVKLKTFGIDVEQAMSQANDAVKGTAFGLGDAATAAAQMSAAGIDLGYNMQQALGLIGDTAAITGSSFSEISSVYSKIAAAGKLDGGTLDQLQDRGVAVLAALSEASGKTQQQVRKDISDGKVSFFEFADAMEASIGGAAQRSGMTVKGAFANLGAALGRIGASMQENLFKYLPGIFTNLTAAVDNAAPAILAATGGISSAITQKLVELSQKIFDLSTQIPQIMQTISQNPAFITLKTAFESIKTSVMQATPVIASMVGSTVIAGFTVLGQVAQAVAGSIGAIRDNAGQSATALTTKYSEALQNITTFTGQVFSAIPGVVGQIAASPVWGTLKSAISGAFDVAKQVLPIFWSLASALGDAAWQIASTAFQSISDGLKDSNGAAQPFADVIQNRIVPWIGEMADKISGLIQQYLPTFVSLLSDKIPQAMDTFANDPAFVEARDNIAEIAEQVIKLIPTFAKLAASGAFIGFSILNDLLQAIAPLLEKVVIPAIGRLSDYLAEHEDVAKGLAFAVGGIFAGGKLVKGIETVIDVISKFKPAIKIGKKVVKWLPKIGPMISGAASAIGGVIAANPIGAIVVGIAAVITGLTLFFTKTETGRKLWKKMMQGIKAAWEKIGKPVLQAIGDFIGWLWNDVIKKVFGWIIDRFKKVFKKIGGMKDAFKDAGSSIADAFSRVKDRITGIIDSIKDKFEKFKDFITAPIKIGVEVAKGLWGKITGKGKKDGYASGGVLPGYTPGRDVHHYINPATGHVLSLSGGEAIMRPEWVRANGGAAGIAKMNRAARGGRSSSGGNSLRHSRFASGGTVKIPGVAPGAMKLDVKEPKFKLDKATLESRKATVNAGQVKEKLQGKIDFAKKKADTAADIYALDHRSQWGQATAEIMKQKASLAEINSKLKNAKGLELKGNEIKELKVERLKTSKEIAAAIADRIKNATESRLSHAKNMADLRAETYSLKHQGPVGQAIADAKKAKADYADISRRLANAGKLQLSKNEIAELKVQKLNSGIVKAQKLQAVQKAKIETGISNKKELSDARAALYAARHKDPVGQAVAEKMQKQSALAEINSKLRNAKALGLSGHEVRVLKVQKLTAAKEFQEALAQPMKIAMDRAAEHRKTMGDLRADTYAKLHDTPVGQAISERMKANNALKDLKYQRSKAIRDGESKSTIREFNAQIKNAAIDARKAAKNVLLTSMETAAAHRKAMADYDADIYAKLHTDPVGQATAEKMKAVATLKDLEAQKRRAIIEGKTAEEIAEFSKQIKIAGIDASDAAKKITLTAMETADNHRKAMSDYDADFYSKLHKDAVGQAVADKMRADATLRDLEAQRRRAIFEGKSVEEIQEFSAQIRNAGIDASEAAKKITLTAMETADNHRKAVGDLNADFYGKQNPGVVGQAIAERMKQENALNDLLAQRQRALIEGQPAESIRELSLQIRNASYDLSEARKNIRKVRDEQRDTHRVNMKTLRAEWMSKANEGNPVAQAKADFYRSRAEKDAARYELKRAKKYGASVQEIIEANQKLKNTQLDVDSAFRKYVDSLNQQRVDLLKHKGSMRSKNIDIYEAKYFDNEAAMRRASIVKAKNAVQDAKDALRIGKLTRASRLEMRELAKDVEVAQAQYIKAQKEAQKQLLEAQTSMYEEAYSYLQSWGEGLEKSGQSLVSSFETIASIGKDLSDISRNITESAFSLLSGISEVVKSFNNIIAAERTLQRSRVEGLASIAKAQGELKKTSKKNLKFIDTSASRLMDAQKASTGFYSTIDKLGGTFKVSTEDIQKSRAALAEARANAAMEAAKAEYDLKKARLESAKKITDQVKATALLNNAMAEYIAKAKLINGLNQRDTDSLAKYYQGVAQKTQGSSMMNAAQAQMAWAVKTGNMAKYQQALGQYYEGQKNASLGAYQMQLYVKEATKAFNALPKDISQGLRDAVARDDQSTRFAVDAALKRRDYDAANAAAKNAGAITSAYIDTVAGFRQIQNDLISRNAQYQRDNIEFAGKMTDSIFDLATSKLDNSFDKANHALQANLDGAQALVKSSDSETPTEKKIWSDYALRSLSDYEKSRKESSRYNRGVNDNYIIDIPKGSAYSSEEVADYMASATKRLDNIEIRLDGRSVAGSDYFYAH
nr:MAG TPA: tail tape measure [Caudoviricetes sp.]